MDENQYQVKNPLQTIFDLPQEVVTSKLRGYGPRRGNLERLLRYWRPIMRKPGGFRRCRVILANHPGLYPLSNICAWLHHETTGKWPNEGCHHPGMKNCKGKLKTRGWTNVEFLKRVRKRAINVPGKLKRSVGKSTALGKSINNETHNDFYSEKTWVNDFRGETVIVTGGDQEYAVKVLREFMDIEPDFVEYIRDDSNWEIEGEDMSGNLVKSDYVPTKCCG